MTTRYPSGLLYPDDTYDPFEVSRADKLQAAARGLLAAGPQLMAAGAPSLTPGGGAQGMANFGLAFNQAYQGHLNNARDTALGKYRVSRQQHSDARQDRLVGLQETEAEREAAERAERKAALEGLLTSIEDPAERAWAIADPAGYLKHRAKPKDPWANAKTVGDQVLVPDGQGGVRVLYDAPDKPALPNSVREYDYAVQNGFKGTYPDWKSSNKPTTTVEFNDKGFDELAKLDAQAVADVGEGVRTLRTLLPDLDRMVAASEKFGTGALANTKLWAGQFARALDIEGVDNLEQGELIRAIQNRLAPQMRATGSGASSDRDVEMFLTSLPNLMQTPGGNKLIADNFRRILERKQAEERIMRQHYRENGGKLDGVYQRIDEELGPSIFNDEDRALMAGAGQGGLPQYQGGPSQGAVPENLPPNVTAQPNGRLRWSPDGDVRKDWQQSPTGNF